MKEKGFTSYKEFMQHIKSDWRSVHGLWERVTQYISGGGSHTHPGTDITSIVANSDKLDGREIYISDDPPSGGNDGDIWFEY